MLKINLVLISILVVKIDAWIVGSKLQRSTPRDPLFLAAASLHGDSSCFLPLQQLDQDYFAPRIVQIAGSYPGITPEEIKAVGSEPSPDVGQWSYDFSDPDGPQLGTVAVEGSEKSHSAEDPAVIIAEHTSLGVDLPAELEDPVDLIVLVDRAKTTFAERKFLVLDTPDNGVTIGAYNTKSELPANSSILGQVLLVQIPWLPCMKNTKSGFMEEDEYF
mmetsp:Transcript_12361/g.18116  ORF Transcript_12361/g.18116 Transcript_12361/m.18116 type:complete len:218 (-) Transcript_12361:54-707(-)|eukprot:CAMPEP_0194233054 /NCGR_PEP_ID=MMETSP0158-20130606/1167_1 /TAXON_ID=33649 /ORGANISM="Thalassionema nitzschioides, Strain L26-B" /LENGTH=217 /DNA_ID=CAMNT_0038965889 /DNA_START=68 /DNA_END=721 /DNA_ORIENTATION=-